jgi:hypothetical protein
MAPGYSTQSQEGQRWDGFLQWQLVVQGFSFTLNPELDLWLGFLLQLTGQPGFYPGAAGSIQVYLCVQSFFFLLASFPNFSLRVWWKKLLTQHLNQ